MSLLCHVRTKEIKPWAQFIQGFIEPSIQGIHTWQGQCGDILTQLTLLISA